MKLTRHLSLLIAILAAASAAPAQGGAPQQMTDAGRERLTGPVRTVRDESEEVVEGAGAGAGPRRRKLGEMTFDEAGRLTRRVIYDDYGFLVGTEVYAHDDRGRRLSAVLTDEKGRVLSRETYAYDAGSKLAVKLTDERYPGEPPATIKTAYAYDAAGRPAQEAYSYQSKPAGKTVYRYDAKGRPVEMAFFGPAGEKAFAPVGPCFSVHRLASVYDDRGRIVEQSAYGPDGTLKRKTTYAYDDRGNVTAEARQESYGSLKRTRAYEFDARGNWIRQRVETAGRSALSDLTSGGTTLLIRSITYY